MQLKNIISENIELRQNQINAKKLKSFQQL